MLLQELLEVETTAVNFGEIAIDARKDAPVSEGKVSVSDKVKYKTCLNTFPTVLIFELCSQIVNEYLGKEKWGYVERIKEDRR